jgi:TRAP transporter 4TM/12TM fusion protein
MTDTASSQRPFVLQQVDSIVERVERVTGAPPARSVIFIALAMSTYHLWIGITGQPVTFFHLPMHLMFVFLVLFWNIPATKKPGFERLCFVWNLFLSALTIFSCGYMIVNIDHVLERIANLTPLTVSEYIGGTGLILLTIEATRRTIGWVLVVVVVIFLAYALSGSVLPYPFWHRGFGVERILDMVYLTTEGVWGVPLEVTASYVFLFILFGTLLIHSGGGEFFTRLARAMTGRSVGGPAKVAVVASTFMGMLSGSSPANVVTTGSFTIPAMKKNGYTPEFAAGVEAAASANGQLTPPIMGAAAFVMMEFVGVSYLEVIGYAAIPAFLCFLAVYIMVDLEARRLNLRDDHTDKIESAWKILRQQGYLLISVLVLLYFLIEGYTPGRACFWSIVSLVVLLAVFDKGNRRNMASIIIAAMATAPRVVGSVSAACAAAGIIVGVITLTGLGLKVSTLVLWVAGGDLLPTLIFTMVLAVILSMGMPTSGAYIVLAVLLAPAMVDLGVLPISAHMFVLYCASKSSITPPVALSSYAAAAMANSDPWRTSIVAFRIALTVFIIPYMFVFGPAILGIGSVWEVVWTVVTASAGLFLLGAGSIGWLFVNLRWWERALFLTASLTMIKPGWISDSTGFLAGVALVAYAYWRSKKSAETQAGASAE